MIFSFFYCNIPPAGQTTRHMSQKYIIQFSKNVIFPVAYIQNAQFI